MKPPVSQYKKILANRFQNHARAIEQGREVKPGILLPLRYLLNDKAFEKQFSLKVFHLAHEEAETLLEDIEKNRNLIHTMKKVSSLCECYVENSEEKAKNELLLIRQKLYDSQPGWKRLWVHATRRRAIDKYALLTECMVETALQTFTFYPGEWVVRLYVFDYLDYRYRVSNSSPNRLQNVANVLIESVKTN